MEGTDVRTPLTYHRVLVSLLVTYILFKLIQVAVLSQRPQKSKEDLKSESRPVVSDSLRPHDHGVHGILHVRILGQVTVPFSRGSSQPRDQTQVSHIAGRFFTSSATREAQEYWSGLPIPSQADLPDPGIKLGSSALQVDSLKS